MDVFSLVSLVVIPHERNIRQQYVLRFEHLVEGTQKVLEYNESIIRI